MKGIDVGDFTKLMREGYLVAFHKLKKKKKVELNFGLLIHILIYILENK